MQPVAWKSVATILGGSWVVISGVISPLIWVIIIVTLLITPLITTHEPPSRGLKIQKVCQPHALSLKSTGLHPKVPYNIGD